MKWNKYPDTKPRKGGIHVVRFAKEVRGFNYGYRGFWEVPTGEYKFADDHLVTHWCEEEDFEEAFEMMKRPSNNELVLSLLNQKSGEELGKFFAEVFSDDEMKDILLEKMSNATIQGIADDEWSDICFEEDCRRENELWASGFYG